MLARATATIAAVVLAGTALSASALYAPPSNEAVCNGQLNSGPGGMFGYSVALSSGADSDYSWMVRLQLACRRCFSQVIMMAIRTS